MADYKRYIYSVELQELLRSELTFSDPDKIRMYSDDERLGVRLRGTYNKWSKRMQFPLDTDINCRLPVWRPQAVKGWLAFEELSYKPEGTAIGWRVSDGTDDYWYTGGSWVVVTPLDMEWNTEAEICDNLETFPHAQKQIQFIAKLSTTERYNNPVLYGYRLMINAQFDWFEDLVLRSLIPRLREDFRFVMDWSGELEVATDKFSMQNDENFKPEEALNIVGIDAVYNEESDSEHETDLLDSFDAATGEVVLTASVPANTRLFLRLIIEPEVAINYTNQDYIEIAKTPCIVVDNFSINARQVFASMELVDKANAKGYKASAPLWVDEMRFNCTMLVGKVVSAIRLMTKAWAFIVNGATQQSNHPVGPILKTRALDLPHTIKFRMPSSYNPKPDLTDGKNTTFGITVCNFYAWLRDVEDKPVVTSFNYTPIDDRRTVGPNERFGLPQALNAGQIPFLYKKPDIEER